MWLLLIQFPTISRKTLAVFDCVALALCHARDKCSSTRVAKSKAPSWRQALGNDTQENECGLVRHEGTHPNAVPRAVSATVEF